MVDRVRRPRGLRLLTLPAVDVERIRERLAVALSARSAEALRETLAEAAPDAAAEALDRLSPLELAALFTLLGDERLADIIQEFDASDAARLVLKLSRAQAADLLEEMHPDEATDVVEELAPEEAKAILAEMERTEADEVRTLMEYPPESAGGRMTPEFVALRPEMRADDALAAIRRVAEETETIYYVYVTEEDRRLVGVLSMRDLVMARADTPIGELAERSVLSVRIDDDQEDVARRLVERGLLAVPVVDPVGRLVGVVTADDVADITELETTEDFHKAVAVAPLRRSYWETSLWALYRLRIGWLAALVLINLASSGVIAAFEETLVALVALAFFIPLIVDTGGNAGTQAAAIMIRALATGDVHLGQWARALLRELGMGVLIGVSLGAMGALLGYIRGGPEVGVQLGLVVFLTMVVMLALTNLIGMLMPFALARVGQDPAVASGPLITSVADAIGLLVYFSIATAILKTT